MQTQSSKWVLWIILLAAIVIIATLLIGRSNKGATTGTANTVSQTNTQSSDAQIQAEFSSIDQDLASANTDSIDTTF